MITPTLQYEQSLWKQGFSKVVGLDEVGRGSFAGPVVVGAVILPQGCDPIEGVADSKLLTPKKREELESIIKNHALAWAIAEVGVSVINKVGIGKATQIAFRLALRKLSTRADFVLMDAFYIEEINKEMQLPIIKGDQKSVSIAAASIIAKVYRDDLMVKLHQKYPNYGFAKHKGYGTKEHQEAIKKFGLSRIHRKSFDLSKFLCHPE